jgi:hypothetical protein
MSEPVTNQPETPLWDLLDQLGLQFRESLGKLLGPFAIPPSSWPRDFVELALPGPRILPGLSDFIVHIGKNYDLTVAPETLRATYRAQNHPRLLNRLSDWLDDRRADRNFADLTGALATRLGPGVDAGRSHVLSRTWVFGRGEVTTYAFPPHMNRARPPLASHAADPGSETEASMTISPGWLPPLTAQERGWLQTFQPIAVSEHWSYRSSDPYVFLRSQRSQPWHFWPADLGPCPAAAIGLSADGKGFVQINPLGLVHVLPRAWLTRVQHLTLIPAKGGGAQYLDLWYQPGGQPHLPHCRFNLKSTNYTDETFGPKAADLAQRLSLSLQETRSPDI